MQNNRNIMYMKHPASLIRETWKEGLPLGNGITGALVFGAISEETCIFTRHDMWRAQQKMNGLPDVSYALKESRDLIDKGDYNAAYGHLSGEMNKNGYDFRISAYPVPLGALTINAIHGGLNFRHYRRGIDMEKGVAFVSWEDNLGTHKREMFISRDDGTFYCRITNSKKCSYDIDFGMLDDKTGGANNERKLREGKESKAYTENTLVYSANTDGKDFGAVMKIEINDGDYVCGNVNHEKLHIESCDFTIKIKTFCEKDGKTAAAGILSEFEKNISYDNARIKHTKLHSAIFDSVNIELSKSDDENLSLSNEELLDIAYDDEAPLLLHEKLWRFGRYLMISGSCEGSNIFPLYGLWAGTYNPVWTANVINENVQIIHWHTLPCNLAFATENLINYYYNKIPRCKENAKKLYGCRGIYIPVYTTPETMDGNDWCAPQTTPLILHWISGAGWLTLHFYDYYKYTKNLKMLNEKILPFIIETARFYGDYVTYDKNGKCRIYPSVSPENCPIGYECVVENATADFAIMKSVFTHLFELMEVDGAKYDIDSEELKNWKKIYSSIPGYEANEDGAAKEWLAPNLKDNYEHRHFSHLFPVFPGDEISLDSDKKLVDMFRKAADMRILKAQSGWSFAHSANIRTRFGDGDGALDILNVMTKGCILNNFISLHNDWRHMGASFIYHEAPVQLDANMGEVNAIQSMLFIYEKNKLLILPALPTNMKYAKLENLCFPEGKISILLDDGNVNVKITANENCNLTLCLPNGEKTDFNISDKETKIFDFKI